MADETISRRALLERAGKLVVSVGAAQVTATSLLGCGGEDEDETATGATMGPTSTGSGASGSDAGSGMASAGSGSASGTGGSGAGGDGTGSGSGGSGTDGMYDYVCDYDVPGYAYCCGPADSELFDHCCYGDPMEPGMYVCAYDVPASASVGERHVRVD